MLPIAHLLPISALSISTSVVPFCMNTAALSISTLTPTHPIEMSHCKTLAEPPCLVSGLLDSSLLDGCLGICCSHLLHEKPPANDQGHEPMFKEKRYPSQMDSPLHGGETRGKATQGGAAARAPGLIALRHRSESSWILSLQIANYQSLDH